MSTETYPKTISRPPATVNGRRVLAWAELQHSDGMYPGGIVLAISRMDATAPYGLEPEYVTWEAYTKDGGQTWHATTGHYTSEHDAARADFADRCAHSRLATR